MDTQDANEFSKLMTRAGLGIEEAAGLLGVNSSHLELKFVALCHNCG